METEKTFLLRKVNPGAVWIGSGLLVIVLALAACEVDNSTRFAGSNGDQARSPQVPLSYALDRPDTSFMLPGDLLEISGLTTLPDGRLAAVQDEVGIVFVLNPRNGLVEERREFAGSGDYEGIAWAGDRLFVVRSNGRLYELSDAPDRPRVVEIKTRLRRGNDVEGLAYDPTNHRLLIALKEDPGSGLDDDMRAVYAFDLSSRALSIEPVFMIDTVELTRTTPIRAKFKPSSIAVHPRTNEVYILSATAGALLILNPDGEIVGGWTLPPDRFEQAEGMTFLEDGTLFISSEGVTRPAVLHRYDARQVE